MLTNGYDPNVGNLLIKATDRAGNATTYTYDQALREQSQTDSTGLVSTLAYDDLDRVITTVQSSGSLKYTTSQTYDQFDQVTSVTHADSTQQVARISSYKYDNYGKLLSQSGTGEYPVTYGYDSVGNKISQTDGNNSETGWSYDAVNRLITKTYADGSTEHYVYDAAGNLTSQTNPKGNATNYTYNAYDLISSVVFSHDSGITFQYDVMGRRSQMQDSTGTTTWAWDSAGRNTGYTQGNVSQPITFTYDPEHEVEKDYGAWKSTYGYDLGGRLNSLADSQVSAGKAYQFTYQANSNWIGNRVNPDGSSSNLTYDSFGRLTSLSATLGNGGQINSYQYQYNAVDQRTSESDSIGTKSFGYNDLRQLTSANQVSSGSIASHYTFSYDSIGNRTGFTGPPGNFVEKSNSLNQVTSVGGPSAVAPINSNAVIGAGAPSYDSDGNMVGDGVGSSLTYDDQDRLTESVNTTTTVNNVYDGLSRRVRKTVYSSGGNLLSDTIFLYEGDGFDLMAEINAVTGLPIRSYTFGPNLGAPLAFTDSTGSYDYFTDGNSNVVDLESSAGLNVAHYEYDPYGQVTTQTGALQQPIQWGSNYKDAESGLVYYGYRFYHPGLGIWTNRDPSGEEGGLNLYGYCNNDPVNFGDIDGLCTIAQYNQHIQQLLGEEAQADTNFRATSTLHGNNFVRELAKVRGGFQAQIRQDVAAIASIQSTAQFEHDRAVFAAGFLSVEGTKSSLALEQYDLNADDSDPSYIFHREVRDAYFVYDIANAVSGLFDGATELRAAGLAERSGLATGIRTAEESTTLNVLGRRAGQLASQEKIAQYQRILSKFNIKIRLNQDAYLDAQEGIPGARFESSSNGTATLYLRSNPTNYELEHELQHARDFVNLGFSDFKALGTVEQETRAYVHVMSLPNLSQTEREAAYFYLIDVRFKNGILGPLPPNLPRP